jgi:hypothetical protein
MAQDKRRHLRPVKGNLPSPKQWLEVDASLVGLSVLSAFNNLDKGEDGEADVEVDGRTLRIRFDPLQKRVLMFELKKPRKRYGRLGSPVNRSTH